MFRPLRYKQPLILCGLGLGIVLAVLVIRTIQFRADSPTVEPVHDVVVDTVSAAGRLSRAIQFRTISQRDASLLDSTAFIDLHHFLEEAFPRVHTSLSRETVSELSLLYTWTGRDTSLEPVLLMAHSDVVPADPASWKYPPFDGVVDEEYVWGRGALDDKSSMMAILEAVEMLLQSGFQPERTVYLSFGHDEEVGGLRGAAEVAKLLASRGVELNFVLDEGGYIVEGIIDGLTKPVAGIGIAEKGYLSLELIAEGKAGHSSVPPVNTSVGILSKAITRLEANPFPARLNETSLYLFREIGPSLPFFKRLALANLWLFGPLVKQMLSKVPETNAMVRTTTAATMFRGSEKDNILPARARAVVNFRILPGETRESVTERVETLIDRFNIDIRPLDGASEPSPISDIHNSAYRILEYSIRQVSPERNLIVAPFLVMGATDSRYFQSLARNIYRYNGAKVNPELLNGYHGPDERIAVGEYVRMIKTIHQILVNLEDL